MKRIAALAMIAGLLPGLAFATGGKFPMAGCGLGYIAFGHQDNSKGYQILSATVNDIISPKTFGMTSGTSGCTEDGAVKLMAQAQMYGATNFDTLRHEMATGEGEYVNTFASLLGANDATRPAFLKVFREDYTTIFPSANTTSDEMLQRAVERLQQHPELIG
jgi:hypothetical protein